MGLGCTSANRKGWAGGKQQGWAEAVFLSGARHWPLDTEGSGGNVCFRSKLQALGCAGPQEAPSLQSQEDLDRFLELQHEGGQPSAVVWTDKCPGNPPPPPLTCPALTLCLFCSAQGLCTQASLRLQISPRSLNLLSVPPGSAFSGPHAGSPVSASFPLPLFLPCWVCVSVLMWESLFISH